MQTNATSATNANQTVQDYPDKSLTGKEPSIAESRDEEECEDIERKSLQPVASYFSKESIPKSSDINDDYRFNFSQDNIPKIYVQHFP